jgi:cytoskeletal protein RodZ
MSDYRDPDFGNGNNMRADPDTRVANSAWGWIAGAVVLVVLLAVAFGIGHQPSQNGTETALNSPAQQSSGTGMNRNNNPASAPAPHTTAPDATNPAPPVTFAPNSNAPAAPAPGANQ